MEDEEKQLRAAAGLPLEERVQHKFWKARKEAYSWMLSEVERSRGELPAFGPQLATISGDVNQGAQDVACDVVLAFLAACGDEAAVKCAAGVAGALVAKALNSRPAIVKKASDIMLLLVERGCAADVLAATTPAFSHKTPKVALAALDATHACVAAFGAAVVPAKAIMPALAKLFDARDVKVRDKAKETVVELARWVGAPPIRQLLLEKMRDAQKAEVESWLADLPPGRPTPARLTRAEQARAAAQPPPDAALQPSATAAAPSRAPPPPADDDDAAYDLCEPVDVVAALPKAFWAAVDDPKWSVRRDALAQLRSLAETPRAASASWHDVVAALKKVLGKDTNVACVGEAAAAVAALARSVRKPLAQFARGTLLALCFERLKDKTANVTAQCSSAALSMHRHCFRLAEVEDAVRVALAVASPKAKELTLVWLGECVEAEARSDAARVHAGLLPAVAALTADAVPATRDAAVGCLAAFARRAGGLAPLERYLDKLDDRRKQQLKVRDGRVGGTQGSGRSRGKARSRAWRWSVRAAVRCSGGRAQDAAAGTVSASKCSAPGEKAPSPARPATAAARPATAAAPARRPTTAAARGKTAAAPKASSGKAAQPAGEDRGIG